VQVDQRDDDLLYVEWQGGRIQRMRKSTGESKDIQPRPGTDDPKFRFNWNTPVLVSPNRDDTVYIGGQFLFRSRDRGETWTKISPDLTTNDPEKLKQIESGGLTPDNSTAENHCTIYATRNRRRTATSFGRAPTMATCMSPATRDRPGRMSSATCPTCPPIPGLLPLRRVTSRTAPLMSRLTVIAPVI
jgi:hypothetical protein